MGIEDRSSLANLIKNTGINGWVPWYPKDAVVAVAGDVLVIPVTHAYVNKTSAGDAEACTLANGQPGQILTIVLGTDGGGTPTVTPVTALGWATIVFADAGDRATLLYLNDTDGWIIVGLSGKTAPPVST